MARELVVSIINFRTGDMTLKCIEAVLKDMTGINGMIVVVDNCSADGSAEQIETWIAQQPDNTPVRLIRSDWNAGFSAGHNLGMAAEAAEFYLVLNSDAVPRPGLLRGLLDAARSEPEFGLFSPVIEADDGAVQNSCFRFPGPASELVRAARSSIVTRLLSHRDVSLGPCPAPENIEWASFACILLRRKMMQEIGPMDEGYFLYFEDVEYCLRARRAGWRIRYVPTVRVVHLQGGSGPAVSLINARKRPPRYVYSSRTRLLYQAHGTSGLLAANLLWYLGRAFKHLYLLAGRRVDSMARREALDIWTNFTRPLGPRFAPDE